MCAIMRQAGLFGLESVDENELKSLPLVNEGFVL